MCELEVVSVGDVEGEVLGEEAPDEYEAEDDVE